VLAVVEYDEKNLIAKIAAASPLPLCAVGLAIMSVLPKLYGDMASFCIHD